MISAAALADGPVRHVVHFKFKKGATPEQIDKVVKEFAALPSKIQEIEGFEWGTSSNPDGRDKGFSYCWILTFKTEKDRDTYIHHPAHQALIAMGKPLLDDVMVVDFTPQK
jgi:hypothetical protein